MLGLLVHKPHTRGLQLCYRFEQCTAPAPRSRPKRSAVKRDWRFNDALRELCRQQHPTTYYICSVQASLSYAVRQGGLSKHTETGTCLRGGSVDSLRRSRGLPAPPKTSADDRIAVHGSEHRCNKRDGMRPHIIGIPCAGVHGYIGPVSS